MSEENYHILSLDGGGSKGIYSLGVLNELEAQLGIPLYQKFRLIYGTSTGAIIAALLAMGKTVAEIKTLYIENIPKIMVHTGSKKRSEALKSFADKIFQDQDFSVFKTDIGIVSTHIDFSRPMIFKTSKGQAHGLASSWAPGFGCKISEALMASSAAYPFFKKYQCETKNQGSPLLMDGGYVANNPTLFALVDALNALKIDRNKIRLFNVGVGNYREPKRSWYHELIFKFPQTWLAKKLFDANTNTLEILRDMLFKDVQALRISETFAEQDYETDLLECDPIKLEKMFQLGRRSYGNYENDIKTLFGIE